jgi:hypothetical protein
MAKSVTAIFSKNARLSQVIDAMLLGANVYCQEKVKKQFVNSISSFAKSFARSKRMDQTA